MKDESTLKTSWVTKARGYFLKSINIFRRDLQKKKKVVGLNFLLSNGGDQIFRYNGTINKVKEKHRSVL